MQYPFGIVPRPSSTEHEFSSIEVFLTSVPQPHAVFFKYSVVYFSENSGLNINCKGENLSDKFDVFSRYRQVLQDLSSKYGIPFGQDEEDDGLELFLDPEFSVTPTASWIFEDELDDSPKLAFIRLEIIHGPFGGFEVEMSYCYRVANDNARPNVL